MLYQPGLLQWMSKYLQTGVKLLDHHHQKISSRGGLFLSMKRDSFMSLDQNCGKTKLRHDPGGSSSLCSVVNWVVNASILQTGKSNKGLLANIWQSHITTVNVCQTNRAHSLKSKERKKERDSWLDLQSGGYQLANIPGCAYASLVVHMFQIRSRNLALLAQLRRTGISIYLSWSLLSHVSWAGHIFHISGTYLDSGRPHNSAPKHIYQPSNVHLECSSKNFCMVAFLSRFHQPTHLLLSKAGNLFLLCSIYYSSTDIRYKSYSTTDVVVW